MTYFIIRDWAGNWSSFKTGNKIVDRFENWEDAEEFLCERLGDNYETDRQEYYIEEFTDNMAKSKSYLDPRDPRYAYNPPVKAKSISFEDYWKKYPHLSWAKAVKRYSNLKK